MNVVTGDHYLAYVLLNDCRNDLIDKYLAFQKRHTVTVTHHVTIAYSFTERDIPKLQRIVDETSEVRLDGLLVGDGIDCFRVLLDGQSQRPSGGTYHLTSSRSTFYRDRDSNLLLSGDLHVFEVVKAQEILRGEFRLVPKHVTIETGRRNHQDPIVEWSTTVNRADY